MGRCGYTDRLGRWTKTGPGRAISGAGNFHHCRSGEPPLTVLIFVCGLVFGPWQGFLYSLLGALLSAMLTFALGHLLGRNTVRRFAGRKLGELNRRLARRGLMTIILVRIIPVAPFTVINMVAGASRIRFRDFMIGSAIGLLPGITGMSIFTDRLAAAIEQPTLLAFAVLAAVVGILIVSGWALWRWDEHRQVFPACERKLIEPRNGTHCRYLQHPCLMRHRRPL